MTVNGRPRIAIWSADWSLHTGQAVVTRKVVENLGNRVDWLPCTYRPGAAGMIKSVPAAATRLWRGILGREIRSVYLVLSRSNLGFLRDIPALLAVYAGCRVVAHVHGSDIVDLLTGRLGISPVARTLYRRCKIVVPSDHLVSSLAELGLRDVQLCENFVERELRSDSEFVEPGSTFTVLWNSNIMASKGFFHLADAVQTLHEDGCKIRLRVLGKPVGDAQMSEGAVKEGLEKLRTLDWVDFVGLVSPEEAHRQLAHADLVALPSLYPSECQPLAVIQAMCSGLPVILADTPALRATAGEYPAVYVRPPLDVAIAGAIEVMIREKTPSSYTVARTAARARFSPERFNRQMQELLLCRG